MFQLDLNVTMLLSQYDDDGDDSVMFLKAVVLFQMVILVVLRIVFDGDSRDPLDWFEFLISEFFNDF